MKKVMKIAGIILLTIIVVLIVAFVVYWYRNIHWYDKYEKALKKVGAQEKQVTLPNGNVINYGEVENDKPALLLIHGQMSTWEDYALVMPKLSQNWHIYAVDVYGHGESTHDESLYYLDINGDDLSWFIDNVIGEPTVISGHSNGAITAAYIAAYGGENIAGVVLEDPPIFSTAGEGWEESFAYLDTYKPLHDYNASDQSECWEAYYLRHCYWGQLYMASAMQGIADYAQNYHIKHPDEAVQKTTTVDGEKVIPPPPTGKNIWGSVTINDRGQLVIPKAVRELFDLTGGQRLIVLSDEQKGIALIPAEKFEEKMKKAMEFASAKLEE